MAIIVFKDMVPWEITEVEIRNESAFFFWRINEWNTAGWEIPIGFLVYLFYQEENLSGKPN